MKNPIRSIAAFTMILLVGTACSQGMTEDPDMAPFEPPVTVSVENDVVPPTSVTVYAVSLETTNRELVGTVTSSETDSFNWQPDALRSGEFRLVGETTAGDEIVSTGFVLGDARTVTWDLSANTVELGT